MYKIIIVMTVPYKIIIMSIANENYSIFSKVSVLSIDKGLYYSSISYVL